MTDEHIKAEEEFGATLTAYAGQWVGVADRTVVKAADTLNELLQALEGEPQSVEIFRVSKHPDAPYFFQRGSLLGTAQPAAPSLALT
jgi:uncharacterized protein DUF5678